MTLIENSETTFCLRKTLIPVSYTHLDVYKRQVQHIRIDAGILLFQSIGAGPLGGSRYEINEELVFADVLNIRCV